MTSAFVIVVFLLVCASVFVNGFTDSPNAIATVVSTRVLRPRIAVILAVIFNFLGVLLMGSEVAKTTAGLVDIGAGDEALVALGAAQLSIVLWSVTAWRFGIPTSESHALIAGLMGAGMSRYGLEAFNWDSVIKVVWGLAISSVVGFAFGYLATKMVELTCRGFPRRKANVFFSFGQIASACLMAFSHGAQDGQKFVGVLNLALVVGGVLDKNADIPFLIMLLCSLTMGVGTSVGGYRIIKTMGIDMVRLEKYQGFSAEIVASVSMLAATRYGIPLSTTNTKATAMMGAGATKGLAAVNWGVANEMVTAWILTFPACLVLGYLFASFFRLILL